MIAADIRWSIYLLLIAVAVGNMTGRLMAVNSVDRSRLEAYRIRKQLEKDRQRYEANGLTGQELEQRVSAREADLRQRLSLQRPFLSANDRSRWLTIRALVEQGTYEIDNVWTEPTWDSIDVVSHVGRDGQKHFYSSKPTLLPTLLAGPYWVIHRVTGATLGTHPYEIGRVLLVLVNILPMVLMFLIVASLAERFGTTDWGRLFVVAVATLGTLLTTFAVVLNNHLVGAVSAAVTLYALMRIVADGDRHAHWFLLAGLASAFTAANELPALAFFALVGIYLGSRDLRRTLTWFLPAAGIVVVAALGTNYLAHDTLLPPYAYRSATDATNNWYDFTYERDGQVRQSHFSNPTGIDRGEESRAMYAVHVLVGHHGVFSLTPVWMLSFWGMWRCARSQDRTLKELALGAAALTVVCLFFYIGLRPQQDRNYGGATSGFRWMFWFAPLWLVVMLPAADAMGKSRWGRAAALALLVMSTFSVAYPTWNPFTHPWIHHWMQYHGWSGF